MSIPPLPHRRNNSLTKGLLQVLLYTSTSRSHNRMSA